MAKTLKERLAEKREDLKKRSGGGKFFTIKEGTTRMRHVPVGEEQDFAVEVVYFYLGQQLGGVISPHTFGQKCAIMNAYNELSESKSEKDRNLAKRFKPQKKFFIPSIKYKDEKGKEVDTDAGIKPLILTSRMYQDLLDFYLDEEQGDFTHPKNGYDIKYKRTGKGKNDTEYTLVPCRPTKLPEEFRKTKVDPEEMVKAITPDYKETKSILEKFLSIPPEDDDDDDNRKRGDKKKKRKKDI